jgi:large subunit GTPase 1
MSQMNKKTTRKKMNEMKIVTKKVQHQYLPAKIKDKQIEDNPEKNEMEKFIASKKNPDLKSALEFSGGVEEYLSIAKMANKKYDALNEQVVLQNIHSDNIEVKKQEFNKLLLENTTKNSNIQVDDNIGAIQIPKRPTYVPGMKPKEFEYLENENYLNWRRSLSILEMKNEKLAITPYEKNINVWRQLWITIEKCNVLIQIVDARNPLFFRSTDLENYIREINKENECILLVNKADLLTEELRISWADYFKSKNIEFIFFSALLEDAKLEDPEIAKKSDKQNKNKMENENLEIDSDDEDDITNQNLAKNILKNKNKNKNKNKKKRQEEIKDEEDKKDENLDELNEKKDEENLEKIENINIINTQENTKKIENIYKISNNPILRFYENLQPGDYKVYDREELIALIREKAKNKTPYHNNNFNNIGFIGYPNVGKSSVINVLMKKKFVGVALMPGKTKHYQTLFLTDNSDICLMDCPGLVFPSFTFSKADLVINGIMPIDKIIEWLTPIQLVIFNIPKHVLEHHYKIILPDLYSSSQFLQVFSLKFNYLTGRSLPDEAKSAKIVLKDYTAGHLLYCYERPDYEMRKHGEVNRYLYDEEKYNLCKLWVNNNINNESEDKNSSEIDDSNNLKIVEEQLQKIKENTELLKQIPANFNDNFELLGIEPDELQKTTLKNYRDVDDQFFKLETDITMKDVRITKEVRMLLKFAMKRGEITSHEFEDTYTMQEAKEILIRLQKEGPKENEAAQKGMKYVEKYYIIKS